MEGTNVPLRRQLSEHCRVHWTRLLYTAHKMLMHIRHCLMTNDAHPFTSVYPADEADASTDQLAYSGLPPGHLVVTQQPTLGPCSTERKYRQLSPPSRDRDTRSQSGTTLSLATSIAKDLSDQMSGDGASPCHRYRLPRRNTGQR